MTRRVQPKTTPPKVPFALVAGAEYLTCTGRFVRLMRTVKSSIDGTVGEFVVINGPGGDVATQPGRRAALPDTFAMREATARACMHRLGTPK
jgi:hypothetical protein